MPDCPHGSTSFASAPAERPDAPDPGCAGAGPPGASRRRRRRPPSGPPRASPVAVLRPARRTPRPRPLREPEVDPADEPAARRGTPAAAPAPGAPTSSSATRATDSPGEPAGGVRELDAPLVPGAGRATRAASLEFGRGASCSVTPHCSTTSRTATAMPELVGDRQSATVLTMSVGRRPFVTIVRVRSSRPLPGRFRTLGERLRRSSRRGSITSTTLGELTAPGQSVQRGGRGVGDHEPVGDAGRARRLTRADVPFRGRRATPVVGVDEPAGRQSDEAARVGLLAVNRARSGRWCPPILRA